MRYVIMAVAAVFALVNFINSPQGRDVRHHILKEQSLRSQQYKAGE